jgi:hypothetical protein
MAIRTVKFIDDDIDQSPDASTISFSYKGVDYTIDLAEKNEAKMDKALEPFIAAATKVGGRRRSAAAASGSGRDLAAIRAWAAEQGIEVSDRGRVAADVIKQYDAAH